jgi:DNA-binding IscR family transcriptional regulator
VRSRPRLPPTLVGPRGGYELAPEQRRITADDILRAAGTAEDMDGTLADRGGDGRNAS